jgi:hypothetical protein
MICLRNMHMKLTSSHTQCRTDHIMLKYISTSSSGIIQMDIQRDFFFQLRWLNVNDVMC